MADDAQDFAQIDISEEEKDKLVADVIRSVLFKTHQSSGCPIKRDELTHLITKNYRQRLLPAFVINEARSKLISIFGYEMKELHRIRSSSTKQRHSSQQSAGELKSYVVVSKLPAEIYRRYVENKENTHITGFTFAVVSVVHLAGGKIPSENLWHHLRRLGLDENDENHPLFGNIKHTLESLVQQRYLHKEKGDGPDSNALTYALAERALDPSFSEKLKDYIGQVDYAKFRVPHKFIFTVLLLSDSIRRTESWLNYFVFHRSISLHYRLLFFILPAVCCVKWLTWILPLIILGLWF